jgi:hypothetical protein
MDEVCSPVNWINDPGWIIRESKLPEPRVTLFGKEPTNCIVDKMTGRKLQLINKKGLHNKAYINALLTDV